MTTPTGSRRDCPSALGEFHLDPAVAAIGFLGVAGIERLPVREAGDAEPVGRYAFGDRVAHDRYRSGRGQLPVRGELRGIDRPPVGVAVDPQDPVDVRWDLLGNLL